MTNDCDFGFVIIKDRSKGSYNNILRLNKLNKSSLVYNVNTDKLTKGKNYA